jgi:phosphoribosylformylglycinamidine synthase
MTTNAAAAMMMVRQPLAKHPIPRPGGDGGSGGGESMATSSGQMNVLEGNFRPRTSLSADRCARRFGRMKARVVVTPKAAVLDPQGAAVKEAMQHLGMPEVKNVRIGKYLEIDVSGDGVEMEQRLHKLCRDLLSNPVIEDYQLLKE